MRFPKFPFILACLPLILTAQTSIGFRDPLNRRPVGDYRLPAWGYRSMSVNFSFEGFSEDWSAVDGPLWHERNFSTYIKPVFHRYSESESDIRDLSVSLRADYDHVDRNNTSDENSRGNFLVDVSGSHALKKYIRGNLFFMNDLHAGIVYSREDKQWPEGYESMTDRSDLSNATLKSFDGHFKAGFGIGRIRNVTPVIRALRLAERMRALGKQGDLSPGMTDDIAKTVSKYAGYADAYDRPDKYFWGDLAGRMAWAESLKPYEFYYLADALRENTGSRMEGSEISAGLAGVAGSRQDAYALLQQAWRAHDSRDLGFLGLFCRVRWYRNLTLSRQIGIESSEGFLKNLRGSGGLFFSTGYPGEWNGLKNWDRWASFFSLKPQFLWTLNDRVLWSSDAAILWKRCRSSGIFYSDLSLDLTTSVQVFMENNLSLTTTAGALYHNENIRAGSGGSKRRNLALTAGLKYYFLRGMQ